MVKLPLKQFKTMDTQMKKEEKCSAVMLGTKLRSYIGLQSDGMLIKYKKPLFHGSQHLYVTSNDEIKEGDYVVSTYDNWKGDSKLKPQLGKILEIKDNYYLIDSFNGDKDNRWDKGHSKKIIKTTDSSLNIPFPSEEFIQEFIDNYNKDNNIKTIKTPKLVTFAKKLKELENKHKSLTKELSEIEDELRLLYLPKVEKFINKKEFNNAREHLFGMPESLAKFNLIRYIRTKQNESEKE